MTFHRKLVSPVVFRSCTVVKRLVNAQHELICWFSSLASVILESGGRSTIAFPLEHVNTNVLYILYIIVLFVLLCPTYL